MHNTILTEGHDSERNGPHLIALKNRHVCIFGSHFLHFDPKGDFVKFLVKSRQEVGVHGSDLTHRLALVLGHNI